ncbi:hypothetical protein KIW84_031440 [Lathyrus oleraceus]|uniref:Uncharacterized protein n=1 Tax=Pisum sativum TaxID=3888 RepID=A0A9D4XUX5_PEA|nr:hypothetical protein KIW84_031440 [Pisum sativum]
MVEALCKDFNISHHNSSPYKPKMNEIVEAANKNNKKIIQKMVVTYKDWHEILPFALHGYRTSICTSIGATLFSLVYSMEVVLPVELDLIAEKRLIAMCHGQLYQQRMKKAFDKKVRPCIFRECDLVPKKILSFKPNFRGKWTPNYEGPYVVKKAFSRDALILTTMDGEEFTHHVNVDAVKKYFA